MTGIPEVVMARYSPGQLARILGVPEPTPEQAAVIGAPLAPMAVIAGAGSGKSETMAAGELASRVRARLTGLRRAGLELTRAEDDDEFAGEPAIATYHAYAGRLIADHALREGLEPTLRLITPAVSWQLAAGVVAAYDGPADALDWTPATVTAAVLSLAGEMAEHLRDAADVTGIAAWIDSGLASLPGRVPRAALDVRSTQRTREQLLPLVAAYAATKAARDVVDYGDQMALAARIAAGHPVVGESERARYQVVLLDEYQDTSHAQLVLLKSLFGNGHPVTAVGDPCQSIYGWRGASAGNLRRFAADFPAAGGAHAAVTVLSTSFRNTGSVLRTAGVLQEALRAAAPDVPLLVAPPGRADRGLVRCALLETAGDEAAWVATQVAGLLELAPGLAPDGRPWPDRSPAQVRPGDIAVLCRKRAQFPALRAALEAAGIPVEVVGLGGLLTVPAVTDIVATLQVLHDPTASGALARLATSSRWRIGPADLVALGRRARSLAAAADSPAGGPPDVLANAVSDLTRDAGSLVEALDDLGNPDAYTPAGYARMTALAAELRMLRGHVGRPLAELVTEVERTLGLDIEVASRPGADPAAARADLDAFADAAAAFAGDTREPTLGAFLAYLAAAESEEFGLEAGQVGETDSVKLATVHAAKGLQWAAVFVPGFASGGQRHVFPAKPRVSTRWTDNARLLPFSLRGDAADLPVLAGLSGAELAIFTAACTARDLAEERRLAYVAATRAAYLLGCSGYWWSDGASRLGPSQFLTEIRAACLDGAGQVTQWQPEPEPDALNPALAQPVTASWPDAGSAQPAAVRDAGALVDAALRDLRRASPTAGGDAGVLPPQGDATVLPQQGDATAQSADGYAELIASWRRDTDLLLAERESRRAGQPATVRLPRQLAVSALVTMARDPAELAQQVRRPMPRGPVPLAARGTAFHLWLEQRFGQAPLIGTDELPGAADELSAEPGIPDLA